LREARGTPIAELRRELGDRVQMFDNGQGAFIPGGLVSVANGLVTGYAARPSFC
jgi:hypothetical protein